MQKMYLVDKNPFWLPINYCTGHAPTDIVRAYKAKIRPGGPKFKFGVWVPLGVNQALELDRKNDNTKWQEAIKTELGQLEEFRVFRLLAEWRPYQKGLNRFHTIKCLMSNLT